MLTPIFPVLSSPRRFSDSSKGVFRRAIARPALIRTAFNHATPYTGARRYPLTPVVRAGCVPYLRTRNKERADEVHFEQHSHPSIDSRDSARACIPRAAVQHPGDGRPGRHNSSNVSSVAITSNPDTRSDGTYELAGGQSSRWPKSWYGIGDQVTATVTFNENITVTGSPQLRLFVGNSSRTATFQSADGTTAAFSYTVSEGDSDTDGITIPANGLTLSGGAIKDDANNNAVLSYNRLPNISNHKVDGIRPQLQELRVFAIWRQGMSTHDNVFDIGNEFFVEASFSERVYGSIAGPPLLNLQLGDTSAQQNGR